MGADRNPLDGIRVLDLARDGGSWDWLLVNARVATMTGTEGYGLIDDGAVAVAEGKVAWVGPRRDLPPDGETGTRRVTDCRGFVITPGLVDCHTHLVFAGNRAGEFEMRLNGISYAEIARRGGGIGATVQATRRASEAELLAASRPRLDRLIEEGVTTVEIKSGYGLETETELKMLRVARELGRISDADVCTTFLGAHALPPEYRDRRADYVDLVCREMMPRAVEAGLCDAVDAFCESIGFTPGETDRVFTAARDLNLPVKLHAEQLSNLGGARLAASHGALSADHLEYLDGEGAAAMGDAGTVAVLLPGAFYFLQETRKPPVDLLREAGVPIAVATDLNPGSSPVNSILATLNLACLLFGLTPAEALLGATRHAARALGLADRGAIAPGLRADLVVWEIESPGELAYRLGFNPCRAVIRAGALTRGSI